MEHVHRRRRRRRGARQPSPPAGGSSQRAGRGRAGRSHGDVYRSRRCALPALAAAPAPRRTDRERAGRVELLPPANRRRCRLWRAFYGRVFGWEIEAGTDEADVDRAPGYGAHLAATIDPGIYERQAAAPPGFADVIAGSSPALRATARAGMSPSAWPTATRARHWRSSSGPRPVGSESPWTRRSTSATHRRRAYAQRVHAAWLSARAGAPPICGPPCMKAGIAAAHAAHAAQRDAEAGAALFAVSPARADTAASIACARSAQRSSASSSPTATRRSPSGTRPSGSMRARRSISVSTPPRLVA